jgi:putative spermidine/putrescine transport system permease protein
MFNKILNILSSQKAGFLQPVASIFLLLPILVLLSFFFLLPLAKLISLSTYAQQPSVQNPSPPHSFIHYTNILLDSFYLQMTANSIFVGFWTTVATLVIAYPVAFYITRISGWERTLISVACLLPLFVNVIVGIIGWYILLLPFGVIQQILSSMGIIQGSIQWLRTFPALIAVLAYEHIPIAVLILVSNLQAIPQDKINAARILGASAPRIFRTLILPLTVPGLVASSILIFALSASSYLTPILISAQRIKVLPLAIFSYGTELLNWPIAAALAFILMIIVVVITFAFTHFMNRISKRGAWEMV